MKRFELYTKDQLNHYESDVDRDQLWANIQRKKTKRKGFGIILPSFIGIFAFGLLSFLLISKVDSEVLLESESNQAKVELAVESPSSSSNEVINEETLPTAESENVRSAKSDHTPIQNATLLSGIVRNDSDEPISGIGEHMKTETEEVVYEKPVAFEPTEVPRVTNNENSVKTLSLVGLGNKSIGLDLAHTEWSVMNDLPVRKYSKGKTGCFPTKSKLKGYVGAYAAPVYALKSLESKSLEYEEYLQRREDTESYLEGFAFGIFGGARHKNGLSLQIGAHYEQFDEKFSISETRIDTTAEYQITGYIIKSPGDTTFINDWVTIVEEFTYSKTTHNYYRFLDIPIELGYDWENGKWFYSIQAGASLNLWFKKKGDIYDAAQNIVDISDKNGGIQPIFKSEVGVSLMGSIGIGYKLTDAVDLFARPYYKHIVKPVSSDGYALKQKYSSAGLKLGLRLNLGR